MLKLQKLVYGAPTTCTFWLFHIWNIAQENRRSKTWFTFEHGLCSMAITLYKTESFSLSTCTCSFSHYWLYIYMYIPSNHHSYYLQGSACNIWVNPQDSTGFHQDSTWNSTGTCFDLTLINIKIGENYHHISSKKTWLKNGWNDERLTKIGIWNLETWNIRVFTVVNHGDMVEVHHRNGKSSNSRTCSGSWRLRQTRSGESQRGIVVPGSQVARSICGKCIPTDSYILRPSKYPIKLEKKLLKYIEMQIYY